MANIGIPDLRPAGMGLFSGSDNLMSYMQDLSENELKITGGGHGKSKSKSKSKSGGSGGGGSFSGSFSGGFPFPYPYHPHH